MMPFGLLGMQQDPRLRPGAGVGPPRLPGLLGLPQGPGQVPTSLSPMSYSDPSEWQQKLKMFLQQFGPAMMGQGLQGGSFLGNVGQALPYGLRGLLQ